MANEEATPQPTGKTRNLVAKVNAYRNLILAVAALATAIGSWFKPQDLSATKKSYDWTAGKIEELSRNDVKTHEDIVGLRNYIEGYVKGQQALQALQTPPSDQVSSGAKKPARPRPAATPAIRPTRVDQDGILDLAPPSEPELPMLKSAPEVLKKQPFDDVLH